ncbi:MAG TPA: hypothetical protein V6C64_08390 [Microcoleaceae cyanobacterium]|jgi:hypothetical protein
MATHSTSKAHFLLTHGGPVDRALEQIGFLPHLRIRIVIAILASWLPLLILSACQGVAISPAIKVSFLGDIAEQTRLLLVIPLLLIAEPIIGASVKEAVEQFLHEGLLLEAELPTYKLAVDRAIRWRESAWAEVILLGIIIASTIIQLDAVKLTYLSTWIFIPTSTGTVRSLAGWWFTLVSMSLYRFLLYRWFWRFIIWFRFLWHMSKLQLQLMPSHPDRAGGLAFLGDTQIRFAILLFAMSAVIAGATANLIVYDGKSLLEYKFTVISFITLAILVVLLPLFTYANKLIQVKEKGQLEYSILGMDYTQSFHQKWIQTDRSDRASLLGDQDVRSLADMATSFDVIRSMNIVPFDFDAVKILILATIIPFVPLILTVIPLKEVLEKMREFLF